MNRKDVESPDTHANKNQSDTKKTTEIPIEHKERSEPERSESDLADQLEQLKEQVITKSSGIRKLQTTYRRNDSLTGEDRERRTYPGIAQRNR